MSPCLELSGLSVRYGGVKALVDVDLTVRRGSLIGLIGPNGAGKTTLVDAVTGFAPSTGSVRFEGREISRLSSHGRARRGLSRTWQAAELFDDLTVRENVTVAVEASRPWWSFARDAVWPSRGDLRSVDRALDLLDLEALAGSLPGELSYGQRKMVGIARSVAAGPRLLVLDEPAAGLDERESKALGLRLRRLLDEDLSMLLIDHDVALVASVCEEVFVLDHGKNLAQGPTADVLADPLVVAAYLGAAEATDMTMEVP